MADDRQRTTDDKSGLSSFVCRLNAKLVFERTLRANPQATVVENGRSYPVTARELAGVDREKVWETAVSYYAGYNAYKHRASHRSIPVILLQK